MLTFQKESWLSHGAHLSSLNETLNPLLKLQFIIFISVLISTFKDAGMIIPAQSNINNVKHSGGGHVHFCQNISGRVTRL